MTDRWWEEPVVDVMGVRMVRACAVRGRGEKILWSGGWGNVDGV